MTKSGEAEVESTGSSEEKVPTKESTGQHTLWKLVSGLCAIITLCLILLTLIISIPKGVGIEAVTVTALEDTEEPKDHNVPLIKQKEALPDYEIMILMDFGSLKSITKPDTSAKEGITWTFAEPALLSHTRGIRLVEKDKMLSDVLAEVEYSQEQVISNGYRFEFKTTRSISLIMEAILDSHLVKLLMFSFLALVILVGFYLFMSVFGDFG